MEALKTAYEQLTKEIADKNAKIEELRTRKRASDDDRIRARLKEDIAELQEDLKVLLDRHSELEGRLAAAAAAQPPAAQPVLRTVKELLTTIKQRPGYYPNSLSPDTTKTELQHDAPNAIESWDNLASDAERWASSVAASEQGNTPVVSRYTGGVGKILDESSVYAHLLEGAFGAVEDLSCVLKQELSPVTFLGVPRQHGQGTPDRAFFPANSRGAPICVIEMKSMYVLNCNSPLNLALNRLSVKEMVEGGGNRHHALRQMYNYMRDKGCPFGILATDRAFWFLHWRQDGSGSTLLISPMVKGEAEDPTVVAITCYVLRLAQQQQQQQGSPQGPGTRGRRGILRGMAGMLAGLGLRVWRTVWGQGAQAISLGSVQRGAHLGSGATGSVYRASLSGLPVALKLPNEGDTAWAAERLVAEVRAYNAARDLQGTALPLLVAHGTLEESAPGRCTPFLAMSLVEGGAPLQEAAVAQQLTWAEAQGVARQAFAHLRALHDRRIAHQDLRADNVLLDGNGRVVLVDLEYAALEADQEALDADVRDLGEVVERMFSALGMHPANIASCVAQACASGYASTSQPHEATHPVGGSKAGVWVGGQGQGASSPSADAPPAGSPQGDSQRQGHVLRAHGCGIGLHSSRHGWPGGARPGSLWVGRQPAPARVAVRRVQPPAQAMSVRRSYTGGDCARSPVNGLRV